MDFSIATASKFSGCARQPRSNSDQVFISGFTCHCNALWLNNVYEMKMQPSVCRYLTLFTFLVCLSFSIPTVDSADQQHVLTDLLPNETRSPSLLTKVFGGLIERIWPQCKEASSRKQKPQTTVVSSKYGDDVVLRFKIKDQVEAQAFSEAVNTLYLDVWEASQDWADVRMSKKVLPSFLGLLPKAMQNSHSTVISDLSQAVHATFPDPGHRPIGPPPHDTFFDNYQPLSVIYPWLRLQASIFPQKTQLFTIGTSFEGRDIPAFRIGYPPSDDAAEVDQPRHTVVVVAGAHAREWITTSTAIYLLRGLLHIHDPHDEPLVEKLLTHYDFVFIPVLNPDGYEYTWTTDRLWRKNRQDTSLPFCRGIDLDRAFPFGWDGDSQLDNPCSESYAGEHSQQATEAQRLVEWAKNETQDGKRVFKGLIDLHAYSQEILYPYSYTCDRKPSNLEDLEEIAIGLAKAFRLTHGQYYGVDSACEGAFTLQTPISSKTKDMASTQVEESGGSLLDFFYHDLDVKRAFQIKLRDTGSYGFLLPRQNILPTGSETMNALLGFGRWLLGNRGIEKYNEMDADQVWGKEEVIVNDYDDNAKTTDTHDDDDGSWFRRRRR